MSPFKEPQPRKTSAADDAKKVIGGVWPPYERVGGEARWDDKEAAGPREPTPAERMLLESARQPLMVIPDHTQFMARTAALEAAVLHGKGRDLTPQQEVVVADIFENYLKNGKPS